MMSRVLATLQSFLSSTAQHWQSTRAECAGDAHVCGATHVFYETHEVCSNQCISAEFVELEDDISSPERTHHMSLTTCSLVNCLLYVCLAYMVCRHLAKALAHRVG